MLAGKCSNSISSRGKLSNSRGRLKFNSRTLSVLPQEFNNGDKPRESE